MSPLLAHTAETVVQQMCAPIDPDLRMRVEACVEPAPPTLRSTPHPAASFADERFSEKQTSGSRSRRVVRRLCSRPVASVRVRRCARLLWSRGGAVPDDCKGDEAVAPTFPELPVLRRLFSRQAWPAPQPGVARDWRRAGRCSTTTECVGSFERAHGVGAGRWRVCTASGQALRGLAGSEARRAGTPRLRGAGLDKATTLGLSATVNPVWSGWRCLRSAVHAVAVASLAAGAVACDATSHVPAASAPASARVSLAAWHGDGHVRGVVDLSSPRATDLFLWPPLAGCSCDLRMVVFGRSRRPTRRRWVSSRTSRSRQDCGLAVRDAGSRPTRSTRYGSPAAMASRRSRRVAVESAALPRSRATGSRTGSPSTRRDVLAIGCSSPPPCRAGRRYSQSIAAAMWRS